MSKLTYEEVAMAAQKAADETGADHGVEKLGLEWRWWRLPRRENRFGYELRCEVRYASGAKKALSGHGAELAFSEKRQ